MKKTLMNLGEALDVIMFFGLAIGGLHQFYTGHIYEGCALLCTCVVWERFWEPSYIVTNLLIALEEAAEKEKTIGVENKNND